jgi:hypothetical protein
MRSTHAVALAILPVVVGAATLLAQQPPTFRAEIDSVQLDVRIVDEQGRFVRDLTASDSTVPSDIATRLQARPAIRQIPIAIR